MKSLRKIGLGLSLGLFVATAGAQEVEWRATTAPLPGTQGAVAAPSIAPPDRPSAPMVLVLPEGAVLPGNGGAPVVLSAPPRPQYPVQMLRNPEYVRMVTNAWKKNDYRAPAKVVSKPAQPAVRQPASRGQPRPQEMVVVPVMVTQSNGVQRVQYLELPTPGSSPATMPIGLRLFDTPPPPTAAPQLEPGNPVPMPTPLPENADPGPSPQLLEQAPPGNAPMPMIAENGMTYTYVCDDRVHGWHRSHFCDDAWNWCFADCGCPAEMFYADAQYLVWWMNPSHSPTLVTTGTARTPVIGDVDFPTSSFSGGRFTAGYWFDPDHGWGVEGSVLFLGQRTGSDSVTSDTTGNPLIARPFVNAISGTEQALLVSTPGSVAGRVQVSETSQLWGAEVNVRDSWYQSGCVEVSGLFGFRYLQLDESLAIDQSSTSFVAHSTTLGPGVVLPAMASLDILDSFGTTDRFYGGQAGVSAEYHSGRWFVDGNAKLALGVTEQTVNINGETEASGFPASAKPIFLRGGLLTSPYSNIGTYDQKVFSVVPEVGVNVGVNITDCVRAYVGYSFLYWSNVVRPGEQVDNHVNPTQLPLNTAAIIGPLAPTFAFHSTDFWAQGVNFGLEFRY